MSLPAPPTRVSAPLLPSLKLDPQTGSGGQAIAVDLDSVSTVRLVGSQRGDVLEAVLPHDR